MINDPKFRDPLYPRDPALRNNDVDPAFLNRTEVYSGSGRTGLAVAVMLIALLVVGLITFTGIGDSVDPVTTASPGNTQQEQVLPPADPIVPVPDAAAPAEQQAPAAAPEPVEPAPVE